MVNGTRLSDTDEVVVTRKKSGPVKKVVLLFIWLALLGGLIFWIKTVGGNGGEIAAGPVKPSPAPTMNAALLEAKWPQIVSEAAAPPRGNVHTPYTIAEFGDFQCPQCGKAYPVLDAMPKKYPAQVNLLFLHRPFPQLHQWALSSGQASEIAGTSGKFWPMYDILYTHQDNLEPGYYGDYAAQAGLDKAKFQAAFDAGQGLPQIKAASTFADSLGIQTTPTALVRNNATKKITIFVGTIGTKNADGTPQYPGINTLAANPPWAGQ